MKRNPVALLALVAAVLGALVAVVSAMTDALNDGGGQITVGVILAGILAGITALQRHFVTPTADPILAEGTLVKVQGTSDRVMVG